MVRRRSSCYDLAILLLPVGAAVALGQTRPAGGQANPASMLSRRSVRGWRKLHLGVDETGVIVAVELTDNTTDDAILVPDLLSQVEGDIDPFTADAAYDKWHLYSAVTARGARGRDPSFENGRRVRWSRCRFPEPEQDRCENRRGR